jgi:hypothetical protein
MAAVDRPPMPLPMMIASRPESKIFYSTGNCTLEPLELDRGLSYKTFNGFN